MLKKFFKFDFQREEGVEIDWLPATRAPTGNGTRRLLV